MFDVYLGPIEGSECLMSSFTFAQHAIRTVPDNRFAFLFSLYSRLCVSAGDGILVLSHLDSS